MKNWIACGAVAAAILAAPAVARAACQGPSIVGEWEAFDNSGFGRWIIRDTGGRFTFQWVGQVLTWRIVLSDCNFFTWWIDTGNGGGSATCKLASGGQRLECAGARDRYAWRRAQ